MTQRQALGLAFALVVSGCGRGRDYVAASCPGFAATPFVAHELTAANGTFRDHCDDAGNLVEYSCANVCTGTDSHGECITAYNASDQAVESRVDCGGTCADAVCVSRCPAAGTQVVVTQVNADRSMIWESTSSGQRWTCIENTCTYPPAMGATITLDGPLTANDLCAPGRPDVLRFTPQCLGNCNWCAYACSAL